MTQGRKPDVTIKLKPANGGREAPEVSLAAYWREGNMLKGGLDKRIKRMSVELEDGTRIDVTRTDGRWSHYVNARDWSAGGSGAGNAGPRTRPAASAPPPDAWDDGDAPF